MVVRVSVGHRQPKLTLRGKGVCNLHTIGDAPVSRYRRPLKIYRGTQRRIFGQFFVKSLACLPLVGFLNV